MNKSIIHPPKAGGVWGHITKQDGPTVRRFGASMKPLGRQRKGYQALWEWFELSHASFCILPRSMMHHMPDAWQSKMAALLSEWDETWVNTPDGQESACWKIDGKFAPFPRHIIEYRHPNLEALDAMKEWK